MNKTEIAINKLILLNEDEETITGERFGTIDEVENTLKENTVDKAVLRETLEKFINHGNSRELKLRDAILKELEEEK